MHQIVHQFISRVHHKGREKCANENSPAEAILQGCFDDSNCKSGRQKANNSGCRFKEQQLVKLATFAYAGAFSSSLGKSVIFFRLMPSVAPL